MTSIAYELIDAGSRGRLNESQVFETSVVGYSAVLVDGQLRAALHETGKLYIHQGFVWDFGSRAIDTPAMVIASLAHDVFCIMTDRGLLPWECRALADKYFRQVLADHGTPFARRWWCWAGVRAYSKTLAYWQKNSKASA